MINIFRRAALFAAIAIGTACARLLVAADSGAAPRDALPKPALEAPRHAETSESPNEPLVLLSSLVGGTWRISTVSGDGKPLRARQTWEWGPGRRSIIAKTYLRGDDGVYHYTSMNVFAASGDTTVVNHLFPRDGIVESAPMVARGGSVLGTFIRNGIAVRKVIISVIEKNKFMLEIDGQDGSGQWRPGLKGTWTRGAP